MNAVYRFPHKVDPGETAHHGSSRHLMCSEKRFSIDGLLQFLHWKAPHCLACWLGLEDAWLLGERVHSLASRPGRFLLELHVEDTSQLELAILLQLAGCQVNVAGDDGFHLLWLELGTLSNSCKGTSGSQAGGLGLH